jgi:uroporphyrinogen-III decarboxylase
MEMSQLYLQRLEKIKKTIISENDKVTTCFIGTATPPGHMGVSIAEYVANPDKGLDVFISYVNEIDKIAPVDCLNIGYPVKINVGLSLAWLSNIKVPGRELPENSLWQVNEQKIMQESDYDFLINNGYDAFMGKILPQVVDMQELQEMMAYMQNNGFEMAKKYIAADLPIVSGGMSSPPFEMLCGARSMPQFFMDCYKMPDKVKAAMDVMLPHVIQTLIGQAKNANAIGAWVGGWRGASALVSRKIWDNLVWPYMYEIGMALIENDITPVFHLDQSWDRDIERFLEVPAKKCILNTDGMTDLRITRQKLGEHVSLMGDVPAQLLATGNPEEVQDYVISLLNDIGPKGVFLTPGCDAPANAKFENMVASYQATQKFNETL